MKTSSFAFAHKAKEEVFQYCFSVKQIDTKIFKRLRLLSITKLQNLKAIHNRRYAQSLKRCVITNHKTTKFESNSQQYINRVVNGLGCYQSQNYEI